MTHPVYTTKRDSDVLKCCIWRFYFSEHDKADEVRKYASQVMLDILPECAEQYLIGEKDDYEERHCIECFTVPY